MCCPQKEVCKRERKSVEYERIQCEEFARTYFYEKWKSRSWPEQIIQILGKRSIPELAKYYEHKGADALILFDLSDLRRGTQAAPENHQMPVQTQSDSDHGRRTHRRYLMDMEEL